MRVERRPIISETCATSCALVNICTGIEPDKAIMLAMHLAQRPYGGCKSTTGPTRRGQSEACHLDPDVQVSLRGIEAGMRLQAGDVVEATAGIDEVSGRTAHIEIKRSMPPTLQLMGYLRPQVA